MGLTQRAQLPDARLDRSSFVPLYHQLHEVLKRHIEAGRWQPGDLMPSEPELCRHFAVSRMVVRQGLAILEDEGRVVRQRGRGTFVAEPNVEHRASGLIRLLQAPHQRGLVIDVLDDSLREVEESIHRRLGISAGVRRITTLLSLAGTPIAISYSHLDPERSSWLERIPTGGGIPFHLNVDHDGIRLGRSELAIEAGECGQREASRLGIPHRSPVFLVAITEYAEGDEGGSPVEIVEAQYRGDPLRCRLELSAEPFPAVTARFAFGNEVRNA